MTTYADNLRPRYISSSTMYPEIHQLPMSIQFMMTIKTSIDSIIRHRNVNVEIVKNSHIPKKEMEKL